MLVLDVSRASSFAFPLIPLAYVFLKQTGFSPRELRILAGGGALVSLLAPNFEVIAGITVKWLVPLPPMLFLP